MSVCTVIIAYQVGRRRSPRKGLGNLSGQPLRRWMMCHPKPQQLPPVVAQNQKRKQAIKGQCRNNAYIDSGDRLSVVSKKCLPGLRGGLRPRIMYFETVDWATSKPSIRSSPWIRAAPHSRFSLLIRRMRSRRRRAPGMAHSEHNSRHGDAPLNAGLARIPAILARPTRERRGDQTGWLTMQSDANQSPNQIPC
jgi:hypothetical protein